MRRILALAAMLLAGSAAAMPLMASKTSDMRQAIDDLTAAAMNHGMQLVKVQPIDHALVKRGFDDPHLRIALLRHLGWAEAADPRLLSLFPLRLSLVQRGDQIVVMSDDLEPWKEAFKDSPGLQVLQAWEVELGEVLQDFAGQ